MATTDTHMGTSHRITQIVDPSPDRRKRLTELLEAFFDDKVSIAELRGYPKEQLQSLAESGHVKFKHGRVAEAEKIFQCLLVLDHKNAYVHSVMGAIHQQQGRPIDAILEFTQALQLKQQQDIPSLVNRGEIYLRHKNFRKAAEDFRSAILMDQTGRHLWSNRARSLVIALKRQIEARRAVAQRRRPTE